MGWHGPRGACGCCTEEICPLWTVDFSVSRVDTRPSDRQYYQPNALIGIDVGEVGEGLLFSLNTDGEWIPAGWYSVPLLVSDPDATALDAQLLGDAGGADHVYYYRKLLSGVERIYEISYGGSPVLKDISYEVTLTPFDPWQDNATTSNGLILSTSGEVEAIGTLPSTPWVMSFENTIDEYTYATEVPRWLDAEDTGMAVEFRNTSTSAVVARFQFRKRPSYTDSYAYPYFNNLGDLFHVWVFDESVITEVTIEGGATETYWGGTEYLTPTFHSTPGMIGLVGGALKGDEDAGFVPPDFAEGSGRSWEIASTSPLSVHVTAIGDSTIISTLKMVAERQVKWQTTTGTTGEILSTGGNELCEDMRVCPTIYPHGVQNWELDTAVADAASFTGPFLSRQYATCSMWLSTQDIGFMDHFSAQVELFENDAETIFVLVYAHIQYSADISEATYVKIVPRWKGLDPPSITFGPTELQTVTSGSGDHGGVWDIANLVFTLIST